MAISCILLIFLEVVKIIGQITFQQGSANDFYYNPDNLSVLDTQEAGRTLSIQYLFPTPFERIPQVYLVLKVNSQEGAYPIGYYLDINSITKEGFTVTVTVPHTNRYYGIIFNWYAFDDLRRIVISAFNYQNLQPSYTFPHSNFGFNQAVVSLVSFVSEGFVVVDVSVDSITQNSVTIKVAANQDLLTYVGFQILIGTQNALYVRLSINFPINRELMIDSPEDWEGAEHMISINGITWDGLTNLNFVTSKSEVLNQNVFISVTSFDNSQINEIFIYYYFFLGQWNVGSYKPMLYSDYFQQKIIDEENTIIRKLTINSISVSLEPTQSQTYIFDKSVQQLSIEIFEKCAGTELWQVKVLKCINNYNTYYMQCNEGRKFNSHKHVILFKQYEQSIQKITVSAASNLIKITQNMIDYEEVNPVILEFSN